MFQTNRILSSLSGKAESAQFKNIRWINKEFEQGGYRPNAGVFTMFHMNANDQHEVAIEAKYAPLVKLQRKVYDHIPVSNML